MAKGGKGARQRRKLKKRAERKALKQARYAASQRAQGGSVQSPGGESRKRRTNAPKGEQRARKHLRRAKSMERQQNPNFSTYEREQLRRLDERLGVGVGATKERARLLRAIS